MSSKNYSCETNEYYRQITLILKCWTMVGLMILVMRNMQDGSFNIPRSHQLADFDWLLWGSWAAVAAMFAYLVADMAERRYEYLHRAWCRPLYRSLYPITRDILVATSMVLGLFVDGLHFAFAAWFFIALVSYCIGDELTTQATD